MNAFMLLLKMTFCTRGYFFSQMGGELWWIVVT